MRLVISLSRCCEKCDVVQPLTVLYVNRLFRVRFFLGMRREINCLTELTTVILGLHCRDDAWEEQKVMQRCLSVVDPVVG